MSRVGRLPVVVPAGVTVESGPDTTGGTPGGTTPGRKLSVKGPKGMLEIALRPEVEVEIGAGKVLVKTNALGTERERRAYHGMTRALIQNMVKGVVGVYEKRLEVVGVGWNAAAQGVQVVVNAGFCKPVSVQVPKGVTVVTPSPTSIVISGPDKQAVGQLAAKIRKIRPPEPYKGKGVRYSNEVVRRKAGKSFGS